MQGLRPTFVLSLDTELIWGSFDHVSERSFAANHPDIRGTIGRLLALLDELEIPATWAVVGHLFLSACDRGPDGRAHPGLRRPHFRWYEGDWLRDDPCSGRHDRPLWYGDDIVDKILDARVEHDVGSHSFSHLIFGDPGCSPGAAEDDVAECVRQAQARGLTLKSFVFPRNREGHLDVLLRNNFIAYRGPDPTWFRDLPRVPGRAAHFLDQATASPPPVSTPHERPPGVWNIPGSMLLFHRAGVRRLVPIRARVAKARFGLQRAVREQKVFHLWFHPENLSRDREPMFQALRSILVSAARLRERGLLDIMSMGSLATRLSASSS